MKQINAAEVATVLQEVRNGETFEIVHNGLPVARLVPLEEDPQKELKEHIERMIAEGKIRRGTGKLPDDFFTRPRPDFGGSAVEELLKEREEGW